MTDIWTQEAGCIWHQQEIYSTGGSFSSEQPAWAGGYGGERADICVRSQESDAVPDSFFRAGCPTRNSRIPGEARALRHGLFDNPQGKLARI